MRLTRAVSVPGDCQITPDDGGHHLLRDGWHSLPIEGVGWGWLGAAAAFAAVWRRASEPGCRIASRGRAKSRAGRRAFEPRALPSSLHRLTESSWRRN